MDRQAFAEHYCGKTVKRAGEDRCGDPAEGEDWLVIDERAGKGIGEANKDGVPRAYAEHQGENKPGGGIPSGEAEFRNENDFRAIQKQIKEKKENGQSDVGKQGPLAGPRGEWRKWRSRKLSQAGSQCVAVRLFEFNAVMRRISSFARPRGYCKLVKVVNGC